MAGGYILLYLRPEFASQVYFWYITGICNCEAKYIRYTFGISKIYHRYIFLLDIVAADDFRYKFHNRYFDYNIYIILYILYGACKSKQVFEEENLTGRVLGQRGRQETFDRRGVIIDLCTREQMVGFFWLAGFQEML